jgi:hypothetical protein
MRYNVSRQFIIFTFICIYSYWFFIYNNNDTSTELFPLHFNNRLECLQSPYIVDKKSNDQWIKGTVSNNLHNITWIYKKAMCELLKFDEIEFCQKAIGCGKKILFVGDSTIQEMIAASLFLFDRKSNLKKCPGQSDCTKFRRNNTHQGCKEGRIYKMEYSTICNKYCPNDTKTQLIYIRHDFLTNKHGNSWLPSTVCEHWVNEISTSDIIVLSFGPHISAMIDYPYHKISSKKILLDKILYKESNNLVNILLRKMKNDSVVMYRSGHIGYSKPNRDCSIKPINNLPQVTSKYHWDSIPKANRIYTETLKRSFSSRLLVMDTQYAMLQWRGCKRDYMHFNFTDSRTPLLIEWQILYNLLAEYNNNKHNNSNYSYGSSINK